jgi:hypothetical protein
MQIGRLPELFRHASITAGFAAGMVLNAEDPVVPSGVVGRLSTSGITGARAAMISTTRCLIRTCPIAAIALDVDSPLLI